MLKTKIKTLSAFLVAFLLAVCCFVFTACGNDNTLNQEATYDQNVTYSDTVSAEESQNVVTAVSNSLSSENHISGYRLTSTIKDGDGKVKTKFNMVYKGKEGMVCVTDNDSKELYLYVKNDEVYVYTKKSDGTEVKIKASYSDVTSSVVSKYSSAENGLELISDYIDSLKTFLSQYTITKNGSNYKFEVTALGKSTIVILQLNNDNSIKSLHVETSTSAMSMDMTLSTFDGNLTFPNLDNYVETSDFNSLM